MTLNENYIAGALAIVAGFIVLYYYYKKSKTEKNNRHIYMVAIGIGVLISGCLGIFFNSLDGINILLFGIVWFEFMRKHKCNCGDVSGMHLRGWIAAIFTIIAGILIILDQLNIFSLWRDL
jgi:hypothetical protein